MNREVRGCDKLYVQRYQTGIHILGAFLVLNSPHDRGAYGVCSGFMLKVIRVITLNVICQLPDRLGF